MQNPDAARHFLCYKAADGDASQNRSGSLGDEVVLVSVMALKDEVTGAPVKVSALC
jgi:hypothetical protein